MSNIIPSIEQLDDSHTIEKYITAGNIASKALDEVVDSVASGVKVRTLCEIGNYFILNEVKKVYVKDKSMVKGIAFPTSVSINNMVGYYSPVEEDLQIRDGDIVNIELGVHIDGYPACVGFTVVVNESDEKITDKRADVVTAAAEAARSMLPLLKTGKTNDDIVNVLKTTASKYNCNLPYVDDIDYITPGVISYQVSKNVIDGNNDDNDEDIHKMILVRDHTAYDFRQRTSEFERNEVYNIDVVMSTGTGKVHPTECTVTIFRRNYKNKYELRMKSSRDALNLFKGPFPKVCNEMTDNRIRLGLKECVLHKLLIPYAPYAEKPNEYVAQVKFTVVIKNKKPILLTGRSSQQQLEKIESKFNV